MSPPPLTFYWRSHIVELRSDVPMNLYSTPVGILRRAMGRSSSVPTLELALKAELGASYQVTVTNSAGRVIVDLQRRGTSKPSGQV